MDFEITQEEPQLVMRLFENHEIGQRRSDGYWNATAMGQAFGKRFSNYYQNAENKALVEALSFDTGIPVSKIVDVRHGGSRYEQGTWVHPDIAVNLAQWCDPTFGIKVSRWVRELLTTGQVTLARPLDLNDAKQCRQLIVQQIQEIDKLEERKALTAPRTIRCGA